MLKLALTLALSVAPNAAFTPKVRPYDALHYRIDLKLADDGTFDNKVTITLKGKSALGTIELDAMGLEVKSAQVDGAAATFVNKPDPANSTGLLTLKPAKPVAAGKEATVIIAYTGKASLQHAGFFQVTDEQGTWYFTHFETGSARAFFPCNNQPDDKATTEVFAVVDGKMRVLSNGRKELDETYSEGGKSLRRVHWKQDQPMSTYLVALAIGAFEPVLTGADNSTVWVRPGSQDRAFVATDALRTAQNWQQTYLGVKYPWAKHDAVAVPHFIWSGMENTSLIFERENKLVLDHKNDLYGRKIITEVLAHETAHQWFGDDVTLKWWDDTWLNEGFATWLGDKTVDAAFDNDMIEVERVHDTFTGYFRAEEGPKSHPLVGKGGASPEEVFDDISYGKGMQVLRMLETWIGPDNMKKSLKAYLEKYAFGSATSADFFNVVGATTKKPAELKAFQESWLKKKGYPVIYPETSYSNGELTIKIRQQSSRGDEKGPWAFKLPIVLHREQEPNKYTKEVVITVDKPEVTLKVEVPAVPQWVNWNKDQGALARVNTPSVSEEMWLDAARNDPDPTWRVVAAWTLAGEMVALEPKSETIPTDAAMGALRDVITKDPSPYVRASLLNRLANTRWKKLPLALGASVLQQARRPTDIPEDSIGQVVLGRSAREVLGRIDFPEGHKFLLDEVAKADVDLNYLEALCKGTANIGTPVALATLRAAVLTQKGRGETYFRRAVVALPQYPGLDMLAPLKDLTKENATNPELVRMLFNRLTDNTAVRGSPEAAKLIQELVLDEKTLGEDLRADILSVLDEVKTKDAKDALTVVAEKATSKRLSGMAKQVLEANFATAAAAKPRK